MTINLIQRALVVKTLHALTVCINTEQDFLYSEDNVTLSKLFSITGIKTNMGNRTITMLTLKIRVITVQQELVQRRLNTLMMQILSHKIFK